MEMTLEGIVTLVRLLLLKNARLPIAVTGNPPRVPGIVTTPPGPVYPVMVTEVPPGLMENW